MIREFIRRRSLRAEWRRRNLHNETVVVHDCDIDMITVGRATYGCLNVITHNEGNHLYIGSFCSIAERVIFLLNAEHSYKTLSSYPFKVKCCGDKRESFSKGDIVVGDDVWLGDGVTILSGVQISQGVVIAAGAVVANDIPPYAIVGGVPARVLKYRYTQPVIDYLLTLDYSRLNEDLIKKHVDDLYRPLVDLELKEIKKIFKWFPVKSDK